MFKKIYFQSSLCYYLSQAGRPSYQMFPHCSTKGEAVSGAITNPVAKGLLFSTGKLTHLPQLSSILPCWLPTIQNPVGMCCGQASWISRQPWDPDMRLFLPNRHYTKLCRAKGGLCSSYITLGSKGGLA